ncbi:bifunctional 23S rRNA (guanine(2069)-N(7))-methyltransferase RlmK/23S rRNA (guanine(2445)-N(2))-methyltransferase RlmL [Vibrio gazogenes]|uniref:Ribosomal RNA large subunit methyltransferase K/L n=1 Tax=Vibrio gazogenes DSM 21264 = NBRC 103151 TaxID=1123492 RepID=A0A1M4ZMA9_VIBGA|nr:bifunctional 23S rRNA (guanine(2069)-N(7))-methyltransferase RlmK/23S rRNA (guanine(2445)-N(2))-methyltransferase RlmL [Vibrio gazogenes]USP15173.1 bifunctional 23S rRNA (guanine(2069)-N(7))-methyltransferase RlmK/23S rRNA (guanine(2445)-N(2))-methyltransferase RlmL [Vibrio gazogenes]SHF18942.1 23S rRNA (guanine2445-N2)-methyltransferase / 23S rRNA (guanine2069-N7)-methyltransferase [Vibrio gazogenes DSM 21264] [Vibrio gazogenes DSM 21264 = NBRC 103151]
MHQYLATTSIGLENLLAEELNRLGVSDTQVVQAGVRFRATNEIIYRCCLWSRIASRFIRVLSEFSCQDDMDLYLSASAIRWSDYLQPSGTVIVDFNGTNQSIRNSQYGAVKVKDAIVDHFTKRNLPRPTISKDRPDLRVHVRLNKEKAIMGIDMVGGSLHIRGYRTEAGAAPLRETLAAAMIMRSGWQGDIALMDPMCGSGTIVIEAAMMAAGIAPGINRAHWGFQSLPDYEPELWTQVKTQASVQSKRGIKQVSVPIYGYDYDEKMLNLAKENARRAGVRDLIEFQSMDAAKLQRPVSFQAGLIISNPPYGERLGTEPSLIALYASLGAQLKSEFGGCKAMFLSSSDELLSCLRMRADKQFKMRNGSLPCHLKIYAIAERDESQRQLASQEVAADFANRLRKNIAKITPWAKREQLDCYRVYDADLPDYNAAIDVYGDHVVIQEYAAPKSIAPEKAKRRLTDMIRATTQVMDVDANHIVLKVREKQKGHAQYQKMSTKAKTSQVQEYGARFIVNLYDYLDTGLFLDHRLTRRRLGDMAKGRDFLNLFAYTGTATVHAALGGAKSTTTVDMSKTYLEWAKENMALNRQIGRQHRYEQADCLQWLEQAKGQYDLIFIDPPTFSNSKRMAATFDVQRDHIHVMQHLKRILRQDGVIVFSNNKRQFKMDMEGMAALQLSAENISSQTLPLDFKRHQQIHNCWLIRHREADTE